MNQRAAVAILRALIERDKPMTQTEMDVEIFYDVADEYTLGMVLFQMKRDGFVRFDGQSYTITNPGRSYYTLVVSFDGAT